MTPRRQSHTFKMLLKIVIVNVVLVTAASGAGRTPRPCVLPIPFELPNRNDRSEQCWIRIEDEDIIETVSTYCFLAHDFLHSFMPEYNSRKMNEDGVEVSLWSEEPTLRDIPLPPKVTGIGKDQKPYLDWRVTTIWDPIIRMRFYVSQNADCKLVMYTREGMTNYKVDCDKLLYFVNLSLHSGADAVLTRIDVTFVTVISVMFTLVML